MSTRRGAMMAAAVSAAAFLLLLLPLPPRVETLAAGTGTPSQVAGALHIHTNRSDGSGSIDGVVAAATRAGLQFVVLTDHGDGTRRPEPPHYRSGVLVIDGVELSTDGGHYIALGLGPMPYPLRGEARDVVEDVRRFGGFGIVAHPDSAKPALRWTDWEAPFDAIEWLNADSEWRDERLLDLVRALLRYPFRPAETLGTLVDRPNSTLERWDAMTQRRHVVAIAGADAHARAGFTDEDANEYDGNLFLRIPSYEATFRTFSNRVLLRNALTGSASADAAEVLAALRSGNVYTAIDALASPPRLDVQFDGGVLMARVNSSSAGTIVIRRNGRVVAEQPLPEARFDTTGQHGPGAKGAYRVEVYLAKAAGRPPAPWLLANPSYQFPLPERDIIAPDPPAAATWSIQGGPWHVEKDARSTGQAMQAEPPTGPVEFRYGLAPDGNRPYAALAISVGNALTSQTRLAFRAHATRLMRISVQVRHPQSASRWRRSVFLDTTPQELIVPFTDLRPVGNAGALDPAQVDTVLFVVDTINSVPGSSGTITLGDLRVER